MFGGVLFYDRNFTEKTQLHIQLNSGSSTAESLLGSKIEITRGMILTTYRYFLQKNGGFYLGGGGGFGNSTLKYNDTIEYTSKMNGLFLTGEMGWQGIEGYYFNIGYQPSFYITLDDNFDVNKIPDISNHRSKSKEIHDNLKGLGILFIGFGWFF